MILLTVVSFLAMQPEAAQLNAQGRALLGRHRYPSAVRVFRQAVQQAEAELGPDDPSTAMMLRNLALAYVEAGDTGAAEPLAKRALAIVETRFGPDEPALTPILNVLAECYASSARIAEARTVAERAVSLGPLAGVHYGIALGNLGAILEASGDLDAAANWYRRAIAVKAQALGADHPHVALAKAALRRVEKGQRSALRLVSAE